MEYLIKPQENGRKDNNLLPSKEDNWIICEFMKIFCFVGNLNPNSQNSYWIKKINEQISQDDTIVLYEASKLSILTCQGCGTCFITGDCPLNDDILSIKLDMKSSDVIIWVSPVYLSNVSGTMKNYIDRICEWIHTLEMSGKIGVIITFCKESGYEVTQYYMNKILSLMGCRVVGEYNFSSLMDNAEKEVIVNEITNNIVESYKKGKQYVSNVEMEHIYKGLKKRALEESYPLKYETDYWKNQQIGKFHTYQEYLEWLKTDSEKKDCFY